MNRNELLKEAAKFDYWFFPYDLGDGKKIHATQPIYEKLHLKKIDYIFRPAMKLMRYKNFRGLNILDCGCNSGFFSFESVRQGASYVLGIEGKQNFVAQAELLKEYFNFSNVAFKNMDISTVKADTVGRFDIVLLMGIIYYLEDPINFMKEVYKISNRYVVIDSAVSFFEDAIFHLESQPGPRYEFAGLTNARLVPSVGAIKAMLYISGFKSFYILDIDKLGSEYINRRIALVASKENEKNFEPLDDKSFITSRKLERRSPSSYVSSRKTNRLK